MQLNKLRLNHFRNIPYADIRFEKGMNFFLGDNAQGKTNALEAIYLFARGRSFRGATDAEMTNFGQSGFSLEISYRKKDREESLSYAFTGKERVRRKNGITLERQADMIGNFRAVLFCPDHLQMIKGSPSERRRFLDIAIAQCYPVYLKIYTAYQKNLEQRNALLKMAVKGLFVDMDMLHVFSRSLAVAAAEICLYRRKYCEGLFGYTKEYMHMISSGKEKINLVYESDAPASLTEKKQLEDFYTDLFTKHLTRECAAGMTLHGVHRDDLALYINGIPARDFASQGQQRSMVLALKMAEGHYIADVCSEVPVFLLDDVLSELDEGRRRFLLQSGTDAQFIVTGCEKNIIDDKSLPVNWIKVENGTFVQE